MDNRNHSTDSTLKANHSGTSTIKVKHDPKAWMHADFRLVLWDIRGFTGRYVYNYVRGAVREIGIRKTFWGMDVFFRKVPLIKTVILWHVVLLILYKVFG